MDTLVKILKIIIHGIVVVLYTPMILLICIVFGIPMAIFEGIDWLINRIFKKDKKQNIHELTEV